MEWRGLRVATHPDVYVPDADTILLAGAVQDAVRPGERFLEVGCGAGLVGLAAARRGAAAWATDLNPRAVELSRRNAESNGLALEVREGDLLAGLAGPFDVVAFNPPYLPTGPQDVVPGPLNLAFDGGADGNQTVLRFAAEVSALRPLPRLVLVVHSSLADPAPLAAQLAASGYAAREVAEEPHFFERIRVVGFTRRGP